MTTVLTAKSFQKSRCTRPTSTAMITSPAGTRMRTSDFDSTRKVCVLSMTKFAMREVRLNRTLYPQHVRRFGRRAFHVRSIGEQFRDASSGAVCRVRMPKTRLSRCAQLIDRYVPRHRPPLTRGFGSTAVALAQAPGRRRQIRRAGMTFLVRRKNGFHVSCEM